MNNALKIFSEIDYVLNMFNPLSYYGKLDKHNISISNSKEKLEDEFDKISLVIKNIFSNEFNANKIQYHLSRLPQLPDQKEQYNSLELFRFKKFIINFAAISKLMNEKIVKKFNFSFDLEELKSSLDIEEKEEETFYINENYSEDLKSVRKEINNLNSQISGLKSELHKKLLTEYELDFRFRDFVIVPVNKAREYDSSIVYVEPYDNKHLVVKPVYGTRFVKLSTEKENHFVKEKQIENVIVNEISDKINSEWNNLQNKINSVMIFDRIFAKAELAKKTNSVRPEFTEKKFIKLRYGHLLALENKCSKRETKYQPLNIELSKNVNILHGSNMSGKTVTLQTLAFFQSLTQLGFFVPAESFTTYLFDEVCYIGENFEEKTEGLSSFGIEIEQLITILKNSEITKFIILDEPARTTNSNEAVALLSAIIEHFNSDKNIQTLLSTHYTNLPKLENVDFFKMKGINWNKIEGTKTENISDFIEEKISLINNNISYEVEKETLTVKKNNDAIKIAEILGLNENIIKFSKKYIDYGDESL